MLGRIRRSALAKRAVLIFTNAVLMIFLAACETSVQPFAVKVPEMGTCKGWDSEQNRPLDITDVFTTKDRRIYMYAYVETNQKLFFHVEWFYNGKYQWDQLGAHETGYMYAYIEPRDGDSFPIGDYEIYLVLGRSNLRQVKFRVVQSDS